jgi:cobalt-zinc-cadmium efflux system membrane fusion protein
MAYGGPPEGGHYVRALAVALLGAVAAGSGCRSDRPPPVERQETIVPVGAVTAQMAAIRAVLHVSGIVVPAEGGEFLVLAPEPTRLVEVMKAAGDMVKSGDVLARFDLPSAAQNVSRLTADVAGAEAQLENARINHERVRGFVERGMVARRDLESAERELAEAQGTVDRARTSLAAAQAGAGRAVVRAPFDGVVATRAHNPGDMVVSTTDPILRVVDPRRLEVVASIPRNEQSRVIVGASARIAAAGVEPVRLTVAGRAADRQPPDDSVPFRLVFAAPTTIAVDSPVQLDIDAEERSDTVLIPTEALVRDGAEMTVFVVAGARAERRRVKTGIQDDARIEITEGVRAGEQVITRGHIGLADGAAITVAVE